MDRNEIVEQWKVVQQRIERVELAANAPDELAALRDERRTLDKAYEAHLPRVAVSRCPLSLAVVHHSLDVTALDGMWWSYHDAVRPLEDRCPRRCSRCRARCDSARSSRTRCFCASQARARPT